MKQSNADLDSFSRSRAFFWPIHGYELVKLIPMLVIFFLISFNYNILRVMKDTLVVTAVGSGPEAIPFIKVWAMFPGTLLMTYLFMRLSNRLSREAVFYVMMSIFLGFFFVFTFILYPLRDHIHCNSLADFLSLHLPQGCFGFVAMIRNWSFSLFYAMSELWGNIVLFVLFWGFANQVINITEAKRFYGVLGIGANLSGIVAGYVAYKLSDHVFDPSLPFGYEAWEQTQFMLVSLVLLSGLLALALFRYMHKNILTESDYACAENGEQFEKKLSFKESFEYVWKSKYLLCIAVIVVVYNIVINLVEVLWKNEVTLLYTDANSYSRYMNQVTALIGVLATLASIMVSGNSIRRFGWTKTALITPVILLGTSILFFGSYFMGKYNLFSGFDMLPLVVMFGSLQNILSRSAKYSVFDSTKEMAFVPLGAECKLKGKAAIDGVGSRLGKSGGSFLQQGLFVAFSGIAGATPYIALLLLGAIVTWIVAVRVLGVKFNELTGNSNISKTHGIREGRFDEVKASPSLPLMP